MPRKVLYIQYTNPGSYPPLRHSSLMFAKRGWQVVFLAVKTPITQSLHVAHHPGIRIRFATHCPPGWIQKLHYLGYCLWAILWAVFWRPTWIYASDSLAAPVALALTWLGKRVLYHEHDTPTWRNLTIPRVRSTRISMRRAKPSLFMRLVLDARQKLSMSAEWFVLPNELRVRRFIIETNLDEARRERVACIWNCPDGDEATNVPTRDQDGKLRVWYHGSVGPTSCLEHVIQAVAKLPDSVSLAIVGYEAMGYTSYVQRLKDLGLRFGVLHRIQFIGPKSREELLALSSRYDVGVALVSKASTDINDQASTGASNKAYEYMARKLAVLVPDLPDWKNLFEEQGYGRACDPDSAESVAEALRWFLENPEQVRAMGRRGNERIQADWNYQNQFLPLVEELERWDRPRPRPARRILYVQYTNSAVYPSLDHSSSLLANSGWRARFLGIGSATTQNMRFAAHPHIQVEALATPPTGFFQRLHYAGFALWSIVKTLRWRPQWVYASDPFACVPALAISFIPRVRVIYHEHDSPGSKRRRAILWARRHLARRATLCVLPNEKRAGLFVDATGARADRVACIWNCPGLNEVGRPRGPHQGDVWVLYHGSIVPVRVPLTLVEALAKLPRNVKLKIVGYETIGHLGYSDQLKALARQRGVADQLDVVGGVATRADLFAIADQCDVGLAFMPKSTADVNERAMTGASNKPFEYLARGLALLVSDLGDWRAMYVDPGYALACDSSDADSLASALRWYVEHLAEMRDMGERGRRRILAEWNYESVFKPVLKLLQ